MKTDKKITVEISEKYALTIQEASAYFGIGEKRIRQLVQENETADYLLHNGIKVLIKRRLFENFLDSVSSL